MLRNSQQYYLLTKRSRRSERLHPYDLLITNFQPKRLFVLTKVRYKKPDLNARNYYDILGIESTATQKEIRKAFLKLSKEYHPDSNAADKSLHSKFVKINEAFSILSKQSTRTTYDQSLNPSTASRYQPHSQQYSSPRQQPYGSPFDWTYTNSSNRGANQQRWNTNESDWGPPKFDKTFFDMLRRKMEQDRKRANEHSFKSSPPSALVHSYVGPFSIISFLIGFGILLHALQWRIAKYSDPTFAADPRTRSYHAYREWQRLSGLEGAESIPMRDSSKQREQEK
ncbi:unnamed protein product [Rotaria magnacalcarata]|uniref:J domain-containing protein n=2 Tax=Rotaria magnacalcarata TaxID=392030 RepID=A0A815HQV7_9BILA|nr:unnamed protein product [Rotaria magnacalcarata]CAF1441662.1 unnamed protein product [Rotaria magnacalcarata]CAF2019796.1 unnamed protein product [Rotaria magnacalcarata]CAF2195269.1 unnamed protein product [Rotaria magnacalcarata]CAF2216869.1 unnamed protein product [Rotaria magnacalcarata]